MTKKIEDFGEKIGGAKKDVWGKRGLQLDDLSYMNAAEMKKYTVKTSIWPKPDYEKMVHEEHIPIQYVYFQKLIRGLLPSHPDTLALSAAKTEEEIDYICSTYTHFVCTVKTRACEVKTVEDLENFRKNIILPLMCKPTHMNHYEIKDELSKCIGWESLEKLFSKSNVSLKKILIEINKTQFCYTNEEKAEAHFVVDKSFKTQNSYRILEREGKKVGYYSIVKDGIPSLEEAQTLQKKLVKTYLQELTQPKKKNASKKKSKVLKKLDVLERKGKQIIANGTHAQEADFINMIKIRGGEFGNWTSQKEREKFLDLTYESLCDLSTLLNVDIQDISFHGELNIAFGSRGHGKALAHYEPMRRVINLTRKKGMGSLAHEWIHAFDDYLSYSQGTQKIGDTLLFSQVPQYLRAKNELGECVNELIQVMRKKKIEGDEQVQYLIQENEQLLEADKKEILNIIYSFGWQYNSSHSETEVIEAKNMIRDALDTLYIEAKTNPNDPLYIKGIRQLKIDEYTNPSYEKFINVVNSIYGPRAIRKNKVWIGNKLREYQTRIKGIDEAKQGKKETYINTEFYNDALYFDKGKSKPYWSSSCEMLARAGSAYLATKANQLGLKNDFLFGNAWEDPQLDEEKMKEHKTYPCGEELQNFGIAFEKLVTKAKELNLLHSPSHEFVVRRPIDKFQENDVHSDETHSYQQMSFGFGQSFHADKEMMKDFKKLCKTEFLELYPQITEDDYFATVEYQEQDKVKE